MSLWNTIFGPRNSLDEPAPAGCDFRTLTGRICDAEPALHILDDVRDITKGPLADRQWRQMLLCRAHQIDAVTICHRLTAMHKATDICPDPVATWEVVANKCLAPIDVDFRLTDDPEEIDRLLGRRKP